MHKHSNLLTLITTVQIMCSTLSLKNLLIVKFNLVLTFLLDYTGVDYCAKQSSSISIDFLVLLFYIPAYKINKNLQNKHVASHTGTVKLRYC